MSRGHVHFVGAAPHAPARPQHHDHTVSLDDVAAAISAVVLPHEEPVSLEVVEEADEVARVDA